MLHKEEPLIPAPAPVHATPSPSKPALAKWKNIAFEVPITGDAIWADLAPLSSHWSFSASLNLDEDTLYFQTSATMDKITPCLTNYPDAKRVQPHINPPADETSPKGQVDALWSLPFDPLTFFEGKPDKLLKKI